MESEECNLIGTNNDVYEHQEKENELEVVSLVDVADNDGNGELDNTMNNSVSMASHVSVVNLVDEASKE